MPEKLGIYIFILLGLFVGTTLDLLVRWQVTTFFYYTFIATFAFLYALSYDGKKDLELVGSSLMMALLLSIPFIAFNQQIIEMSHNLDNKLVFWFIFPFFFYIAHCFNYAFHQDNTWRVSYVSLFAAVWNTIILLIIAMLFSSVACGLIMLGAIIFKATGFDFLWKLLNNTHISFILNTTLFFVGLSIGQQNLNIIYSIRFLLLKAMYYLFPILASISILYLVLYLVQIITGGVEAVQPLMILAPLSVMGILFFNAYYQDGDSEVVAAYWLQHFLKVYRVALFIIVLMMLYHLFKRYAVNSNFLIVVLCALFFSFTYAITAYLTEPEEKKWIRIGNISTALFFLAAVFLFNLPYMSVNFTVGNKVPAPAVQTSNPLSY